MTSVLKCAEGDEPAFIESTRFTKLQCHIETTTNYLYQGLAKGLEESIEKKSEALGRTALYKRTSRVSRLPRYLLVQFVRFFWRSDTSKKAKILRKVIFPDKLDMLPYVDDKLKASLLAARQELQAFEEERQGLLSLSKKKEAPLLKDDKSKEKGSQAKADKDQDKMTDEKPKTDKDQDTKMTDEKPKSSDGKPMEIESKEPPAPTLTSGNYELFAVVTHQGRSADSGHYVGWCKKHGDVWLKFDDDVVTESNLEAVKALCGGGDWHMSYFTFYRRVDDFTEVAKNDRQVELVQAREKRAAEDAIVQKAKAEEAAKKQKMSKT